MKITTMLLVGITCWAGYELHKTHQLKKTISAMKDDVSALRNKVTKMASTNADEHGITPTASTGAPTKDVIPDAGVGTTMQLTGVNGSAWSNYVGQPKFTNILSPNDPRARKDYNGTDYNSIFRKKPIAFSGSGPFTGWN